MASHNTGATMRVGKILGEAFDRRAGDAGLRRAPRYRGRRCAIPRRGRRRGRPLSSALATFATCRCRLRCAIKVLASKRGGDDAERQPQQLVLDSECDRSDDAEKRSKPRRCRRLGARSAPAASRLSKRSSAPIRLPIQVTGWPIARNSALRITQAELDQHGEERKRDGHRSPTAARTSRCCMAAILPPRGGCFPAPPNLSSTFRPGSIPIPIRCRILPAELLAALAGSAPPCSRARGRRGDSLRRAVGGACRAGAGHANSAAAGRRPGAARRAPRSWRRPMPSTRAPRRLPAIARRRDNRATSTALGDADACRSSPIPTIRTAGSSPKTICSRSPGKLHAARRHACGRRGLHGCRPARRKPRRRACPRQHRRAALVRQILRACRIAARFRARRAAARRAACGAARPVGGFRRRRWPSAARRWRITAWIETTRRRLAQAAARLDAILSGAGPRDHRRHDAVPAGANARGGRELFHHLGRAGILVRSISGPCDVAALRPAGGTKQDWRAAADCDGCIPRQRLGFRS